MKQNQRDKKNVYTHGIPSHNLRTLNNQQQ